MLKTSILGRVGNDAIAREVSGKFVVEFSIAHTERWTDKDGNKQERTTWLKAVKWMPTDSLTKYIKTGDLIYLEGSISTEAWISSKETEKPTAKSQLVLRVSYLEFAGSKNNTEKSTVAANPEDAKEDDLPF